MTIAEFYLIYDTRRERNPDIDYAGNLTEKDCEGLWEMMHG